MNKSTRRIYLTTLCLLLSAIGIFSLNGSKAIANEKKPKDPVIIFQPPPEDPQPEETEGAASRQDNKCTGDLRPPTTGNRPKFKAIVPQGNSGLTTQKHPTFWVYLPPTKARQAMLSIAKAGASPHWQQSIDLTGKSGTMGIKLNENAPGLGIGQNYRWALILVCGDRPHPNDPVVTAGIKRIEPANITNHLPPNATRLDWAAWYARQGIWYDALDILAQEKSSLSDGEELWLRYLQSGGF